MTQQECSTGTPRTQDNYRPLRRVVVKEEFVALTGDFNLAVVLGQLEYWQQRVRDVDQYIREERERVRKFGTRDNAPVEIEETRGWIYKSAEQMIEETMLGVGKSTMLRYFNALVEKGYVLRRHNPNIKYDRTFQYRLDLPKMRERLEEIGYSLSDWTLSEKPPQTSKDQDEGSKFQNEKWNLQNEKSKSSDETAIPEITSETTNSSSEETPLEEEPFDFNSLPDDTTTACLILLSRVKNFPRDHAKNALYLGELRMEFKDVDARAVVRDFEIWHRDNETSKRGIRQRLRNFFKSAEERGNRGSNVKSLPSRQPVSDALTATATPEAGIRGLKEWEDKNGRKRLAVFASLAERYDFTGEEEPAWPILARLGNDDDERGRNLKACRNITRRYVRESAEREVG